MPNDEINLLDYWRVIWKHRILIGVLCATSVLIAMTHGLISPKIYKSKTTILLPKEGGGGGVLSLIAAVGISTQFGGTGASLTPNRDFFISIIKSRLMAQTVAVKFKLQERYRYESLEEAIEAAQNIPQITQTNEGVIEIAVEDVDPKIAADIANFYTVELDRLVTHFEAAAVSRQRRFIEEQITRTEKDLRVSEENMRQFQEGNRAFLLGDRANSMGLPGTQVPKVGLEMARLGRDVKVQETVYTMLTQQLEQAKIAEARDMPVVQVLDPAVPARHKSKPNIKQSMALAAMMSLIIGIFLAFIVEYVQSQRSRVPNSNQE